MIQEPVIKRFNKSRSMVQPVFTSRGAPFANFVLNTIKSPLIANSRQLRVVILHSNKRATGIRLDIRLTAEVLDYSFTSAVSDCGHVERTSLLFTAVESQLSERQVCSEFIHGTLRQKRLVVMVIADSAVWRLHWHLWWRRIVNHNVGDKKPASWNQVKLNYHVIKQPAPP